MRAPWTAATEETTALAWVSRSTISFFSWNSRTRRAASSAFAVNSATRRSRYRTSSDAELTFTRRNTWFPTSATAVSIVWAKVGSLSSQLTCTMAGFGSSRTSQWLQRASRAASMFDSP